MIRCKPSGVYFARGRVRGKLFRQKNPAHHEKDCGGDGCAAIELGFYELEQWQQAPLEPPLALAARLFPLPDAWCPRTPDLLVRASCSPPALPELWQFVHRAALPLRAPSIVS